MIRHLIRARHVAAALVVASLAGLLAFGRHVTYEQSLTSFFPGGSPVVRDYQRASRAFGNDNVLFIAYDDPALLTPEGMTRVAGLAGAVGPGRIEAVTDVQSLDAVPQFWMIDDRLIALERAPAFLRPGLVRVAEAMARGADPAMRDRVSIAGAVREATDPAARQALRERITTHPLLRGTLVGASGRSTAVVVRLKGMAEQDIRATVRDLRAVADRFAAEHDLARPALVGPPVLLADGFDSIEIDGRRLALAGMALIGLVTLTATRSLWWAVMPIVAGWTIWLGAETVLALLGLKLSLSGGPLVAQIIVLTMPAASHLAIHFRDDLRSGLDRREAATTTLRAVTRPILWCALTGTIGYGALLTSNVVPVRQFGAVLAVCTALAALLTVVIAPAAMLPPFPLEWSVRPGSESRVGRVLNGLTAWVERHPAPIVVGVLAVVLPTALGIGRLRYESNYINAFKADSRVVRDYQFVESRLGGIGLVSLVVPVGETMDLEALRSFRALDEEVAALGPGRVSGVVSPATVLDPEGRLTALPDDQAGHALATKLRLIDVSPQADLLGSFWDRDHGLARVVVRIPEQQPATVKEATCRLAEAGARARFGPRSFLTGLSYLLTQTTRGVMATSWTTFGWAVGGILLMLVVAFRGPMLAGLALLPSLLAVGLVLGLMGWLGIKLDLATALVASVALGLSVDDTFHCLLQYRRRRLDGKPVRVSLFESYAITGPGVLLSSLAVAAGFAVLWVSAFVPFANFGVMVGIATLGSSLGNLVLLPACLALGHRLRGGRDLSTPVRASEDERADE